MDAYFASPLAQGTPGKQCSLAATGDYQPSLRSPWLAAIDLNPSITHLWLTPHSSEPVTECRRLGESVEIQHAIQRLITLKMTNIIQMKASFVLHQNECLEEF